MQIVLFTHPFFLGSQSMPRFAAMLVEGMRNRGHSVEILSPKPVFFNLPFPSAFKKWLGYIDQYIAFPNEVRKKIRTYADDTLFVFADQALGPWIPLVADRPHIIHCHDFLAQNSALGSFKENPVSWTGIKYQRFIRSGYLSGKNFISVSNKTRDDLHQFYPSGYQVSEVVYNGLSDLFRPQNLDEARLKMSSLTGVDCDNGYILNVGGNQWYKNRRGIIEIYNRWRDQFKTVLPLLMIGAKPSPALLEVYHLSSFKNDIHFLSGVEDEQVRLAYAGASVFIFPSLAEGFGWPIAEAMASGTPVITTNQAPMTEVAGDAAVLIDRRPSESSMVEKWTNSAAQKLNEVLSVSNGEREKIVKAGVTNARRFDSKTTLDDIEKIYLKVLYNKL